VTFTCSYDSGPHSGFDLCNFNFGSGTLFKFDAATGSMEINVNVLEKQTFAHGDYFFTLKANMLGQEVTVQFEYRLQDPCNRGQLQILQNPFEETIYYRLKHEAMLVTYNLHMIGGISPLANCGTLVLEFSRVDDRPEDPFTFMYEQQALAVFTDKQAALGTFSLNFKYFYADDPAQFDERTFTVEIFEECQMGSFTLHPPTLESIVYVMGAAPFSYELPVWTSTPVHCALGLEITPDSQLVIDDPTLAEAMSIVDNTLIINSISPDDLVQLAGTDPAGKSHTVTLGVETGGMVSTTPITLIFTNPCKDSTLTTLIAPQMPDFTYFVGDPTVDYIHEPFTVVSGTKEMADMCTTIEYTETDRGLGGFMDYASDTRQISIFTEDYGYVGYDMIYVYEISAKLQGSDVTAAVMGSIDIRSPCSSPSIEPQVVTNCDTNYEYPAIFNFPCTFVEPIQCEEFEQYSCQYVSGPYQGSLIDSCNYESGDGLTEVRFDFTTGYFYFLSTDEVTFPVGEYKFKATIMINFNFVDVEFSMFVHNCPETQLSIAVQPQPTYDYILGSPSFDVWFFAMDKVVVIPEDQQCGD
jgi:hypothetical protein